MSSKYHFPKIILLLAGLLVAASACAPQSQEDRFFTPTGPFSIGVTSRQWVDEARDEVLTEDPDDKRTITVWIWYPADVDTGATPRPYLPDENVEQTVKDSVAWFSGDVAATTEALSQIHLNAVQDASLTDSQEAFPVVVFTNGLGPLPSTYSFQVEELASHGYIVLTLPHLFGHEIKSSARIGDASFTILSLTELMGQDIFFVLDRLEALNVPDSEEDFSGRLKLEQIGIVGHSLGGDVALWATKRDSRLAAALVEDGYPEEEASQYDDVTQPVLFMLAENTLLKNYYRHLGGPAYVMQAEGIRHSTYPDQALWPKKQPLPNMFGTIEPERAVQIINAYVLAFFDQHLKGVEQPILKGPSSQEYPEVTLESRNTAWSSE